MFNKLGELLIDLRYLKVKVVLILCISSMTGIGNILNYVVRGFELGGLHCKTNY